MISNPVELAAQRAVTAAFIGADFETIILIPREKAKTTTGGHTWTELPPRDPQDFKLSEVVSRARTEDKVPGGEQAEAEFMLIGLWNAVIGDRDVFDHEGARFEVIDIEPDNGYERRATVRRYGR